MDKYLDRIRRKLRSAVRDCLTGDYTYEFKFLGYDVTVSNEDNSTWLKLWKLEGDSIINIDFRTDYKLAAKVRFFVDKSLNYIKQCFSSGIVHIMDFSQIAQIAEGLYLHSSYHFLKIGKGEMRPSESPDWYEKLKDKIEEKPFTIFLNAAPFKIGDWYEEVSNSKDIINWLIS